MVLYLWLLFVQLLLLSSLPCCLACFGSSNEQFFSEEKKTPFDDVYAAFAVIKICLRKKSFFSRPKDINPMRFSRNSNGNHPTAARPTTFYVLNGNNINFIMRRKRFYEFLQVIMMSLLGVVKDVRRKFLRSEILNLNHGHGCQASPSSFTT